MVNRTFLFRGPEFRGMPSYYCILYIKHIQTCIFTNVNEKVKEMVKQ